MPPSLLRNKLNPADYNTGRNKSRILSAEPSTNRAKVLQLHIVYAKPAHAHGFPPKPSASLDPWQPFAGLIGSSR